MQLHNNHSIVIAILINKSTLFDSIHPLYECRINEVVMGAPKGNKNALSEAETLSAHLQCRIKPSDKIKLQAKAAAEGITFCAWIMRKLNK